MRAIRDSSPCAVPEECRPFRANGIGRAGYPGLHPGLSNVAPAVLVQNVATARPPCRRASRPTSRRCAVYGRSPPAPTGPHSIAQGASPGSANATHGGTPTGCDSNGRPRWHRDSECPQRGGWETRAIGDSWSCAPPGECRPFRANGNGRDGYPGLHPGLSNAAPAVLGHNAATARPPCRRASSPTSRRRAVCGRSPPAPRGPHSIAQGASPGTPNATHGGTPTGCDSPARR
jgi:hypothetical protein